MPYVGYNSGLWWPALNVFAGEMLLFNYKRNVEVVFFFIAQALWDRPSLGHMAGLSMQCGDVE